MRAILSALVVICSGPAWAEQANYRFEWQGGGGFVMRGALSFDAGLLGASRIYETDLACFEIAGTRDGAPVGRWALGMLAPDTTWTLTFDPAASAFVVYGAEAEMPQAWNMDGFGENCGSPGFGFNIGNAAQDLCVDGALMVDSQVPPPRPFPATRVGRVKFSADACRPSELLSGLHLD